MLAPSAAHAVTPHSRYYEPSPVFVTSSSLPRLLPNFFDELDDAYEDLQEVEQRVEREVEDVDFARRLDFADHRVGVVPNFQGVEDEAHLDVDGVEDGIRHEAEAREEVRAPHDPRAREED